MISDAAVRSKTIMAECLEGKRLHNTDRINYIA